MEEFFNKTQNNIDDLYKMLSMLNDEQLKKVKKFLIEFLLMDGEVSDKSQNSSGF